MKKKFTPPYKKCKVRINVKKFENIQVISHLWGIKDFQHCLN
ncbi:MAG: hypothetical protein ACOVMR_05520 [Flavobacteriales bacterium]